MNFCKNQFFKKLGNDKIINSLFHQAKKNKFLHKIVQTHFSTAESRKISVVLKGKGKVRDDGAHREEIEQGKSQKYKKNYISPDMATYLSIMINMPFYISSVYLIGSYMILPGDSNLLNTAFYTFKALSLSHSMWGGVHFGFAAYKLESCLNKGDVSFRFDYKVYKGYLPGLVSFGITQVLLNYPLSLWSLSACFLGYAYVDKLLKKMDEESKEKGESPYWYASNKRRFNKINLILLVLLYAFMYNNLENVEKKKLQIKSIERTKKIYELEDENYKEEILENKHLLDQNVLKIAWSFYKPIVDTTEDVLLNDPNFEIKIIPEVATNTEQANVSVTDAKEASKKE